MKKIMLAVYDSKVESYGVPFPADTVAQGVRDFTDAVNDSKTMFCKHPEDYSLFVLGEFDGSNGSLAALPAPRQVITALECVKKDLQ